MSVKIDVITGRCPVESEGSFSGIPFYFRARGDRAMIGVGGEDPVEAPQWECDLTAKARQIEPDCSSLGWLAHETARVLIHHAADRWQRDRVVRRDGLSEAERTAVLDRWGGGGQ